LRGERLKHVAEIRVSNVDKKAVEGDPPVLLCNYTDVYYNERITHDMHFMSATATPDQRVTFALNAGDVVLTKDSETADDIGVSAVVLDEVPDLVCGYHLAIVRARSEVAYGPYLRWVLAGDAARQSMSMAATGVTRFGLRSDAIADLEVLLPSLDEQRSIADYLDRETARIDALIAAKQRMTVLVRQQAEAHRARWYEQLAQRSGVVPLRRLIHLLEQGWSPQCDNSPAVGDEWGVLKTSSVSSGAFRADENKRLPAHVRPERRWVVRDGDLLVVRGSGSAGAVGQAAVAHPPNARLLLSDLLYRVHLVEAAPEFVADALRASQVRSQLEGAIRTDTGQTLKVRGDDLRALLIPALPATAQQRAVEALASVLRPLAKISDRLTGSIDLLRERREALITAAVTGGVTIAAAA
jgi:type I restriction enzyme S subunit